LLSCCRIQSQHLFLVAEDIQSFSSASRAGNEIGGGFVTDLGGTKRPAMASLQKMRMANRNKFYLLFNRV